ncbi:hypothetical protein G5I_04138 [Acromyrmex echinatior]|uniref:Uncharacterized protein n=1 Tax=Acromyrmex echinatior TaxID=103372 RepID=F4WET9_ACREC|nr:hypothetical protein G5I_04138 [Acromyrmex echinatior]
MGGEESVAGVHRDEVFIKDGVRAYIKVVIPSGLIGIYDFSRSLSGPFFQFCQTLSEGSSLADANHSRDVEPKKKNRGVCRT